MANVLTDDILRWTLDVNGKPAMKELGSLEQSTKALERTNKELRIELQKMEAAGKKNTAEYKQLQQQMKGNSATINDNKSKMEKLRKEIGINSLTAKQLRQEYRRLKTQMDNTTPGTAEWKRLDKELTSVKNRLGQVNTASRKTNQVMGALKSLLPVAGVAALVAGFKQLLGNVIGVRQEFEKYEAILTNSLGSQKAARKELNMLKQFAAETPFALTELTGAFVKLTNYGLKPTRDELVKYGDLASSVGKGFDQLTEAIADAVTFEFERLKEFGIKAEKEGDKITFTFKEQATVVDANAQSIKEYMSGLGELQGVAGSMAAISKTIGGRISNLGDAWDSLMDAIGGRSTKVFSTVIGGALDMVEGLTNIIGEKPADIIRQEGVEIAILVGKLTDANTKTEERVEYLKQLEKINPNIVAGIDAESISYETLAKNAERYNQALVQRIVLAKLNEQEQDVANEAANVMVERLEEERKIYEAIYSINSDIATGAGTLEEKIEASLEYLKQQGITYDAIILKQTKVNQGTSMAPIRQTVNALSQQEQLLKNLIAADNYRIVLLNEQAEIEKDLKPIQDKINKAKELVAILDPKDPNGTPPPAPPGGNGTPTPARQTNEISPELQALEAGLITTQDIYAREQEATAAHLVEMNDLRTTKTQETLDALSEKEAQAYAERLKKAEEFTNVYLQGMQSFGSGITAALSGDKEGLKEGLKGMLFVFLDYLKKLILVKQVEILTQSLAQADSIATFGAAGGIRAAIIIGLIEAAFAGIKGAITNFDVGGYTSPGEWDKPQGIVHSNEFVANRFATQNPTVRPVLDMIDYAQRSGTISNLNLPAAVAGSAQASGGANGGATTDKRMTEILDRLEKRLAEPPVAILKANQDYMRTHNQFKEKYDKQISKK